MRPDRHDGNVIKDPVAIPVLGCALRGCDPETEGDPLAVFISIPVPPRVSEAPSTEAEAKIVGLLDLGLRNLVVAGLTVDS